MPIQKTYADRDYVNNKIDELSEEFYTIYVSPEMYGAAGDGVTDDTQAIKDMMSSGYKRFFFRGTYLVKGNVGEAVYTFEGIDGIEIITVDGSAIKYESNGEYTEEKHNNPRTFFLRFNNCKNINVKMNFVGDYSGTDELGYHGVSVIGISSCEHCNFQMSAINCRDVIWHYPMDDVYSNDITARGSGSNIGYFFAGTGVKNIIIDCDTSVVHRSVYLAAAENIRIYNNYNTQYIADYNVILTGGWLDGECVGIKNADIVIKDKTSKENAIASLTSYSCGISLQEYDHIEGIPSIEFSNIKIEVYKTAPNTGCIGISGVYEYEVKANNIEVIVHDSRPSGASENRVIGCTGEYSDRIPFRITGYSENLSVMNNGVVSVENMGGNPSFMGGSITLRGSRVTTLTPNSLVILDMYSVAKGLSNPKECIFQGRDGVVADFSATGISRRSDEMLGKTMCVIYSDRDVYLEMQSFTAELTDFHTVFSGVVRGGHIAPIIFSEPLPYNNLKITVPEDKNTERGFDLTDLYAQLIV